MWCEEHCQEFDAFARSLDAGLWGESATFARALEQYSREKLAMLSVDLGGGAHYQLLYFLTRLTKPRTVVETGVAAGFSSHAILKALAENGEGHLYSSDFPYFRMNDPEAYVGLLVTPALRERWSLYTKGDRKNLKMVTAQIDGVDLLHYDSDKSYSGRSFAFRTLSTHLTPRSLVIMDDMQDNFFFRDYVQRTQADFRVFAFGRKFVGLMGL